MKATTYNHTHTHTCTKIRLRRIILNRIKRNKTIKMKTNRQFEEKERERESERERRKGSGFSNIHIVNMETRDTKTGMASGHGKYASEHSLNVFPLSQLLPKPTTLLFHYF